MTRQLVVLAFFHRSIRTNSTTSDLIPMLLLRIVVFLDSVLLVVVLTPDCILPILDSINRKSTRDTKMLDSLQIQHQVNLSSSHIGKIVFPRLPAKFTQFIPSWIGSGTLNRIWYFHRRELLLQVVQHLYSTLLVVLMRDSLLRLQKEQFYSIFLVLQTRVSPKTLLDLEIYYSRKRSWNHYSQSYRLSTSKGVGSASFSGSALVIRSSFDPPEGTYLHIFGGRILRLSRLDLLLSLRKATYASGLENLLIQISTSHLIMVSIGNIGIETGMFTLAWWWPGRIRNRSWHCYHKVLYLSTLAILVNITIQWYVQSVQNKRTYSYSRCYLHSWYWYRW